METYDNTIDFLIRFEQDEVIKKGNRVITADKIKRIHKNEGGVSSYDTYIVADFIYGGYLGNKILAFRDKITTG